MSEQNNEQEKLLREIILLKQKLEVYENAVFDQFGQIGENPITVSILNAVPHALVGLIDRKIVFANKAVKTVFNIESDKAIGQSTRMFYRSDEDFKRMAELVYPILEGKEFFSQEFPCRTYDNRDIICNVSAARLGNVLKNQTIVVMYEDITLRKQAEQEIKNSHKLFQKIIDLLPIRIFWKDKNLNYLGCNKIFAQDAGKNTSEDMIGKDDFQMGWKDQAEIYQADDRQVIKSRQAKLNFEEPQTTPSGSKIWLKTSKVPLIDSDGNELGMLGTYEDITARKQIEAEHVLFRNLIDQSTDAIFVMNPDTGGFLDVNQRACDSLGYSKQELLTMTVLDIDPLFTAAKFSAHIEQELKITGQVILETKHQRKDGYQFFVEINSKFITIENKQYILSIARDISDRKQAEAELKQSVVEWDRTFNSIEDLIFIQDLDNVIVKANRAFADFLKMPLAEIEGRKCYELLHKHQHVFSGCPMQFTKKEQISHSVEINDPQLGIPLFVTTAPIFDEHRQMVGVLHIAKNISREKQAEKELKRKLRDLEIFRKSSVGREIKMLEMKKKIEELEKQIAMNK